MIKNKLPRFETPKYSLIIPSTKTKVFYRPFVVKEEKMFLISINGKEPTQVIDSMKTIIDACTFGKLKIDTLTSFDIEFLFIHIYCKSKKDKIPLSFNCKNLIDTPNGKTECNHTTASIMDLNKVYVSDIETYSKVLKLSDTTGIVFKTLGLETINTFINNLQVIQENKENKPEETMNLIFGIIANMVESIYMTEDVYSDLEKEDIVEFLETLPPEVFSSIENYFINYPKVKNRIEFTCEACGNKETHDLYGLMSFLE